MRNHAQAIVLLFATGAVMTPQGTTPDPDFVQALSTNIRGIYSIQIENFPPEKVETEFRKIVRQPSLTSREALIDNLMYVVRKKDILSLRPDVERALTSLDLKPKAELSAMKTLYAIGGENERQLVDERFARRLYADFKNSDGVPTGPYLLYAERVGGPKTLTVLQTLLPDATARQRAAESAAPADHVRIGRLDKVRSSLDSQIFVLARRLKTNALPDQQRTPAMLQFYLDNTGYLGFWAFVELSSRPSPARIEVIRKVIATASESARLHGLLLLNQMKAPLSPEEDQLLKPYLTSHRPDWEDVLDSI